MLIYYFIESDYIYNIYQNFFNNMIIYFYFLSFFNLLRISKIIIFKLIL